MKHEFNDKELFEIEKWFDHAAGLVQQQLAQVIMVLDKIKTKESKQLINKSIKEALNSFDLYRTISAKAESMRTKR